VAPLAPLVTAAEMRAIEARAAERGETGPVLMDRAARSIAALVAERLPTASDRPASVVVLVGPGNNGGDGLWAARYLRERGVAVSGYCWRRAGAPDPARQAAAAAGVRLYDAAGDAEGATLAWLVRDADAVIDALLGFGLERDITGDLADLIRRAAAIVRERAATRHALPVFAVDLPTGVDSDTGRVRGVALPAGVTITLGAAKRGLYLAPGAAYAGEIILADIGVADLTKDTEVGAITPDDARRLLPPRPADSNKGTFGSVIIVAGSLNYIGACSLAALGAMRVGVGLATLATPIDLLPVVAARLAECTFLPLPSDMGVLAERAAGPLLEALGKRTYQAMLIGNGLGQEKETLTFLRSLLHESPGTSPAQARAGRTVGFNINRHQDAPAKPEGEAEKPRTLPPLVIDADGLNLLHQIDGWSAKLPAESVLTPHPGEMARLLGSDVEAVQADRVGVAQRAAAEWKQIVVLKGAGTIIAAPDGRTRINRVATAALATAGTGDVLAGAIAGFLAQGLTPFDAAVLGVYIHGRAGELVAEELGDAGVLAGDVADALPYAIHDCKLRGL
jgi:ADP-dependent NAD(P)H-hydrate dehydratase / NAD(P)H-hydrate epimerase